MRIVRSKQRPGTHPLLDLPANNTFSRQTESFKHLFDHDIRLNRLWDLRLLPGMPRFF